MGQAKIYKKEEIIFEPLNTHPNFNNLTGEKFNKLTVIGYAGRKNKQTYWWCQCDCGNIIKAYGGNLKKGATKSCGCLQKEIAKKTHSKNLIGQRFGKLVVLEEVSERKNKRKYWKCQCDCGNTTNVETSKLTSGWTQSCGCLQSKGELKISQLLNEEKIPFEKEKTFDTCYFSDTNSPAYFDFYVNNKYLIEYDGIQHNTEKAKGWISEEKIKYTKEHDEYKNLWCKENKIPLIRIPYTHFKNLCLEDLKLETSKFII